MAIYWDGRALRQSTISELSFSGWSGIMRNTVLKWDQCYRKELPGRVAKNTGAGGRKMYSKLVRSFLLRFDLEARGSGRMKLQVL